MFYTVRKAADRLEVSAQTVRRLVQDGKLRAHTPRARGLRILAADVEAILNPFTGTGTTRPTEALAEAHK